MAGLGGFETHYTSAAARLTAPSRSGLLDQHESDWLRFELALHHSFLQREQILKWGY